MIKFAVSIALVLVGAACATRSKPVATKPTIRSIAIIPATNPTSFTLLNLSGLSFLIPLNETVTYLDSKEKARVFNDRLPAPQSALAKDFNACVAAELRAGGFRVEVLDQVVRPAQEPDKVDHDKVLTTADAVLHVRFTEVGLFSPRSSTDYLPRVNAQATLFAKGLEDDLYSEDFIYGVDARAGKAWSVAGDPQVAYSGFDKVLASIVNVRLAFETGAEQLCKRIVREVAVSVR
jgi:hypothetical protein